MNITKNKLLLAGIIIMILGIFPAIGFTNPIVSFLSLILIAIPSYYYFYRDNPKTAIKIIIIISLLAITIETIGITTGFPYSSFEYSDMIGYKLFQTTPIAVLFVFTPLVLGAAWLANKKYWLIAGVATLVITDMVLDPAMVALNVWTWSNPGIYYGVPFVNFLGWIFTSTIALFIYKYYQPKLNKNMVLSLYITIAFWTGANLFLQLLIPSIIGILMMSLIIHKY